MHSTQKLHPGLMRLIPAAAVLAALFVPLVAASADDDCPPGGCPIAPPQSREVNPSPAQANGSAIEVPRAAELPPVEITVHVLAPAFVDPAPIGASFETVSVPVRYQNAGDVSCGVQALGMALDALPGAAPTSASLLGLLDDNGMMYDFGTGVEELAYAAQSFGYEGSFAFHGATMDQLRGQLATGSPVVVSLGTETTAGHFVTVTGISSDGKWVAYNDPTLGAQVISATEFERLWGLQGNSGVVVAKEPPPEAGDADVLAVWAAFTAGLMALVSTTPLGKFRQGIGGRIDAGGGDAAGVSRVSKPAPAAKAEPKPKAAARSDPPDKEKAKKTKARFDEEVVVPPATPKATKARFDEEIALPPKATSGVVMTPAEQKAASTSPSKTQTTASAKLDEEHEDKEAQSTGNSSMVRFDDEIALPGYDASNPIDWLNGKASDVVQNALTAGATIATAIDAVDDAIGGFGSSVAEFASGVVFQLATTNIDLAAAIIHAVLPSPDMWELFEGARDRLDAWASDSSAFQIGRLVGGALGIGQGLLEVGVGAGGGAIGTVAGCVGSLVTGPGAPAACGASAVASEAVGLALAVHGVAVVVTNAVEVGDQIAEIRAGPGNGRLLTSDEHVHVDRIENTDAEAYIRKHPDALTEPDNGPHVEETRQLMSRIRNSIEVLKRSLPHLDAEAEAEALQAISQGESKLRRLGLWFAARGG